MPGRDAAVLTVSVAAELSGMHPQTVRQYDRLGLVRARRTRGGGRRYSLNDVDRLLEIQRLSQKEGINLAGIARIIELEDENARLRKRAEDLSRQLAAAEEAAERRRLLDERVFAAGSDGRVLVVTRDDLRSLRSGSGKGEWLAGAEEQPANLAGQVEVAGRIVRLRAEPASDLERSEGGWSAGRVSGSAVVLWRPR